MQGFNAATRSPLKKTAPALSSGQQKIQLRGSGATLKMASLAPQH